MEAIYHRLVVRDFRVSLNYYDSKGGRKLARFSAMRNEAECSNRVGFRHETLWRLHFE